MVLPLSNYAGSVIPESIELRKIISSPWNSKDRIADLSGLIFSIQEKGLLQPILVRIEKGKFVVVAGNRRLEACRRLHWRTIPCLVREFSDKEAYEVGLIENIQRQTLTPIEEAMSFRKYVNENGWGSSSELARAIGRSEEYVSHRLSLLKLPPSVLELLNTDKISPSVGQELVWLKDPMNQKALAGELVGRNVSTAKVRQAVRMIRNGSKVNAVSKSLDASGGDTLNESNVFPALAKTRRQLRAIEKSVVVFRICMTRLDSIIEEIEPDENEDMLKRILVEKRYLMHNQIDELLRLKRSYRNLER